MNELIAYQRNLFAFFEEFFQRATGYEKMEEKSEQRELAGSLIGVLANARDALAQEE